MSGKLVHVRNDEWCACRRHLAAHTARELDANARRLAVKRTQHKFVGRLVQVETEPVDGRTGVLLFFGFERIPVVEQQRRDVCEVGNPVPLALQQRFGRLHNLGVRRLPVNMNQQQPTRNSLHCTRVGGWTCCVRTVVQKSRGCAELFFFFLQKKLQNRRKGWELYCMTENLQQLKEVIPPCVWCPCSCLIFWVTCCS